MTLTTTQVTGPIYLPNGVTPFGGRVSFELSRWDVELEAGLVVSGPIYETIDENGQFSVELYTSSAGEHSVTYRMYVIWEDSVLAQSYVNDIYVSHPTPHYTKKYIGSFSLSGPGPYRLDELNIVSELNNDSFDAYLEMKAFADRIDLGVLDSSTLSAQESATNAQQSEITAVAAATSAVEAASRAVEAATSADEAASRADEAATSAVAAAAAVEAVVEAAVEAEINDAISNLSIDYGVVDNQIAASIAAQDLVVMNREQAIAQSVTDLTANYQGTVAMVQTHSSALAGLNGSVATLDLTTVAGTQYVAGIKATSWDGSGSGSGSLLQLLGDNVVAEGTLSTNRLAVGLGKNLLENSSFKAGLRGWSRSGSGQANADTTVAIRAPGQPWAGVASPTLEVRQYGSATTGETIIRHAPIRDVSGAAANGIAVVPGEVIEASVNISPHRCVCDIRIHYYNAAGVFVADSGVLQSVSNNRGIENNPEQWDRIGGRHTVPEGAVLATIALYKMPTASGEADSYAFWYHPQLCRSHAKATTLTPYSPDGTTLVEGGSVVTGSLMAEAANVGSFSSAGLSVFGGNLQSANWDGAGNGWRLTQAGELTVPNATIGTLKLPDGAISTLHQSRWGAYYNTGREQWQRSITLQFGLDYDSNCYIRMWTQWAAWDNGDNWLKIHFSPIGYLRDALVPWANGGSYYYWEWTEYRRLPAGVHTIAVDTRKGNQSNSKVGDYFYFDVMAVKR